jgi:hypothetical protein
VTYIASSMLPSANSEYIKLILDIELTTTDLLYFTQDILVVMLELNP